MENESEIEGLLKIQIITCEKIKKGKVCKMNRILNKVLVLFLLILVISNSCFANKGKLNTVNIEYNNMKFTINNSNTINLKDPLKKILRKYKYEIETSGHTTPGGWPEQTAVYKYYNLKEYPIRFVEHKMSGIAGLKFYLNQFEEIEFFNNHKSGVNFSLKIFGYTFNSDTDILTIENYLKKNKVKFEKEIFLKDVKIDSSLSNSCFDVFIFINGKLDYCSISVEKLKKGIRK